MNLDWKGGRPKALIERGGKEVGLSENSVAPRKGGKGCKTRKTQGLDGGGRLERRREPSKKEKGQETCRALSRYLRAKRAGEKKNSLPEAKSRDARGPHSWKSR